MGTVTIQEFTTRFPITMIGKEAGVCWGADITDERKNYKRGLECLSNDHGRTLEFPDVYMIIDGYSARVMREWYTHIGGAPTRLQASTRYIDYKKFPYVTPPSIAENKKATETYDALMHVISTAMMSLEKDGIPKEDIALCLPLGMETKVVCKHNARNLIDMSHQRLCKRAYHEYRKLFRDLMKALGEYSEEWATLVDLYFKPKCEVCGSCKEKYTCGRMPKREQAE